MGSTPESREWQDHVTGVLETPFGPMEYAITQGDHVSISAGGSSNKVPAIEVNGVPYYTHIHLHLLSDGSWGMKDFHGLHMSRPRDTKEASSAARKKAEAGIADAWTRFIGSEPRLLNEAEWRHLNNEIMSVEEEAAKKRKEYDALVGKHEDLLARERELLP